MSSTSIIINTYKCIDITVTDEDMIQSEKNIFDNIVNIRINHLSQLPLKKTVLDYITKYEGEMFVDMFRDIIINDTRIYASYSSIAVQGYSGETSNGTLYIFTNEISSEKKKEVLYISVESISDSDSDVSDDSHDLSESLRDSTVMCKYIENNLNIVLWGFFALYSALYMVTVLGYLSRIK